MRKTLAAIMAVLIAGATVNAESGARVVTLAAQWDLEGAANGSGGNIVADVVIADSASLTIVASALDQARPITVTVTDANSSISAGTLTLIGTQADGTVITATYTLSGGSGAKTGSVTYNWKTITSATLGVITGEDGVNDKIKIDTAGATTYQYPMAYGERKQDGQGRNRANPYKWRAVPVQVITTGSTDAAPAASATVAALTASTSPFAYVSVGDLLWFKGRAHGREVNEFRVVTARASADSITVGAIDYTNGTAAVDLGVNGMTFFVKKFYASPDLKDGWFDVSGLLSGVFVVDVAQMNVTGGIAYKVVCRNDQSVGTSLLSGTIAAAGITTLTLDFQSGGPFSECRIGLGAATNDDANDLTTNTEIIGITFNGLAQ